jgi:uncharacterized membrane protein YedE/YeeE
MPHFTPWSALTGGVLIGLSATALLLVTGRVAGISGIVGGLLRPAAGEWTWRAAFLAGLLTGGLVLLAVAPTAFGAPVRSGPTMVIAGLLVGFGARMGRGCTSGHGVCGLSRLDRSSLVSTVTFMAVGIATASAVRVVMGAAG